MSGAGGGGGGGDDGSLEGSASATMYIKKNNVSKAVYVNQDV